MRNISKIILVAFIASMAAGYATNVAFATEKSPRASGFDHGCEDSFISDPKDFYINQPGKGISFHTEQFLKGYDAGFAACADEESQEEDSTVTWEAIITNNQAQAQEQYNRCGNIVLLATVHCSNEAGQAQQND